MKLIKIGNKEIELKNELNDLTIGEFANLLIIYHKGYEEELEKYIDVIANISNLTKEEIEDLDLDLFEQLLKETNLQDLSAINREVFINKFELDGQEYTSTSDGKSFILKTKQMFLVKSFINLQEDNFLNIISGLIFTSPTDNEMDIDSVLNRANKFKDLKMDIIAPYLLTISEYFNKRNV